MKGVLAPGYIPVSVYKRPGFPTDILIDVPPELVGNALRTERLIIATDLSMPTGLVVSRFLAKVAVEAMATKLIAHPDGLEYLVDEQQLDAIRDHARTGRIRDWPVHFRQIYDTDAKWFDHSGSPKQVVNEYDILVTEKGEWYFVFALFGKEFVINYGGPDIEGYQEWLDERDGVSPLYSGKNANEHQLRRSA